MWIQEPTSKFKIQGKISGATSNQKCEILTNTLLLNMPKNLLPGLNVLLRLKAKSLFRSYLTSSLPKHMFQQCSAHYCALMHPIGPAAVQGSKRKKRTKIEKRTKIKIKILCRPCWARRCGRTVWLNRVGVSLLLNFNLSKSFCDRARATVYRARLTLYRAHLTLYRPRFPYSIFTSVHIHKRARYTVARARSTGSQTCTVYRVHRARYRVLCARSWGARARCRGMHIMARKNKKTRKHNLCRYIPYVHLHVKIKSRTG